MKWIFFILLYFIIFPVTIYVSQKGTLLFFTLVLLGGYSAAFALGRAFQKGTLYSKGDRLLLHH